VEQSSGRSWVFVVVSRGGWGLRDGTPPNKEKHHQTRKPPFKQEKYLPKQEEHLSSKGNAFQARGIFQSNVVYKW
jgi:hypothetical protein